MGRWQRLRTSGEFIGEWERRFGSLSRVQLVQLRDTQVGLFTTWVEVHEQTGMPAGQFIEEVHGWAFPGTEALENLVAHRVIVATKQKMFPLLFNVFLRKRGVLGLHFPNTLGAESWLKAVQNGHMKRGTKGGREAGPGEVFLGNDALDVAELWFEKDAARPVNLAAGQPLPLLREPDTGGNSHAPLVLREPAELGQKEVLRKEFDLYPQHLARHARSLTLSIELMEKQPDSPGTEEAVALSAAMLPLHDTVAEALTVIGTALNVLAAPGPPPATATDAIAAAAAACMAVTTVRDRAEATPVPGDFGFHVLSAQSHAAFLHAYAFDTFALYIPNIGGAWRKALAIEAPRTPTVPAEIDNPEILAQRIFDAVQRGDGLALVEVCAALDRDPFEALSAVEGSTGTNIRSDEFFRQARREAMVITGRFEAGSADGMGRDDRRGSHGHHGPLRLRRHPQHRRHAG